MVSLHGESVGPGLHWYLPEPGNAMFYAAQVFEAKGCVLDHDVRGFFALDQIYLPDGASFYRDDPIAANDLLVAFFIFGTRWDDGPTETGHIAVGHGRFGTPSSTISRATCCRPQM